MTWRSGQLKHWLARNDSGVWGEEPDGVDDVEVLRSTDIALDGSWRIEDPALRSVSKRERNLKTLKEGDLVVVTSSGSEQHLGKTAIVTKEVADRKPCFANFVQRLTVADTADARYVRYVLSSRETSEEMANLGNTTTGLRNLNGGILGAVTFPGAPFMEQRAIADYLDAETARIDALITKKQQLIHLLEERVGELIIHEVLRGLSPSNGTGDRVSEWEYPKLGVLIELQRGHDLPSDARQQGTIPIVSSGGISGSHDVACAKAPGVVTGRYGTVGEVFFIEEDYWPLNTTLYVSDFRGNDPLWVSFLLRALPLEAESEKSAVGGINRNVIGDLRTPRPSLPVQRTIANELQKSESSSMQTSKVLQRQVDLLAERRQALITAAVTGEFTVPGVA